MKYFKQGYPVTRLPGYPVARTDQLERSKTLSIKTEPKDKFWRNKELIEMNSKEWEALCDGCGKCCLHKYEDDDGLVEFTDVCCKLLDQKTARCSNYVGRKKIVKDCVNLKFSNLDQLNCLPRSCAYRLLHNGEKLKWWHYLECGDREMVHKAGMSVKGRCISEVGLSEEKIEYRTVKWPNHIKALRRSGLNIK